MSDDIGTFKGAVKSVINTSDLINRMQIAEKKIEELQKRNGIQCPFCNVADLKIVSVQNRKFGSISNSLIQYQCSDEKCGNLIDSDAMRVHNAKR
jgi:hypothetical protein